MRCLFYSSCEEPKYLCCNFCSNTKCEIRCKDDHTKCKLYEEGNVEVDKDKVNHIIKKPIKRGVKEPTLLTIVAPGNRRGRPRKDITFNVKKVGRGRPKKNI